MGRISKMLGYGAKVRYNKIRKKPLKPKWICYTSTEICNSRCVHCNIWKTKPSSDRLTVEELRKAFSDPFMSDVEYILVTGGEPSLRPDIIEVFKTLHDCCPKAILQLSTNGIAVNKIKEIVAGCMDYHIKLDVGLSVDGVNEKHDTMRGIPGNFDKIRELIEFFKQTKKLYPNDFNFILSTTLSGLTVDNYDELEKFAKDECVELAYSYYQDAPFYGHKNVKQTTQYDKETTEKLRRVTMNSPGNPRREMILRHLDGKSIKFPCYALQNFFVLSYNGNVSPCLFYSDVSAGNIKKNSFKEILTGKSADIIRKKIIDKCPGCLNSWSFSWSAATLVTPYVSWGIRHPIELIKVMKNR